MVIPPNIWQDNFLTGSTPFAVYPRLLSAPSAPINYGFRITPSELPRAYTPSGVDIFASGARPRRFQQHNTVLDVDRYEQDTYATASVQQIHPGSPRVISALNLSGVDRGFGNATLFTLDDRSGTQVR